MNNDYNAPASEPTEKNEVIQTPKENSDVIILDQANVCEVILPEKVAVIDKQEKNKKRPT